MVYRKNLFGPYFKIDEFKKNRFLMEDTPFWAEIAVHSKIHYIHESFVTHLILKESITQSKDKRKILRFWISNAEMCLYLCNKHGLPNHIKELHKKDWRRKSLQLAFIEKKSDMAEIVKKKCPKLSLKDWIWYWGAKHPTIRPFVVLIKKLCRNQ